MPTPVPMEPMDSYLCVLLKLDLIQGTSVYTQAQICDTIANNQTDFDAIYNNPAALTAARNAFMNEAQHLQVVDKREDCG